MLWQIIRACVLFLSQKGWRYEGIQENSKTWSRSDEKVVGEQNNHNQETMGQNYRFQFNQVLESQRTARDEGTSKKEKYETHRFLHLSFRESFVQFLKAETMQSFIRRCGLLTGGWLSWWCRRRNLFCNSGSLTCRRWLERSLCCFLEKEERVD